MLFLSIAAALLGTTVIPMASPRQAQALSGGEFKAGRIIDDVIFTDNTSMSAQDIQNFLNAKVPNCDTYGQKSSTRWNSSANRYYTRAEWAAVNGLSPPFTCLRDYIENPATYQNNYATPGAPIQGGNSAAMIIKSVADAYRINPQVLLVTLQKEQGLVTDDWPWNSQYQKAMGYGCPDTAGCAAQYSGFYRQVDRAGWQFRRYLDSPGSFNHAPGLTSVRYHPNSACGSSVVNIESGGTAALYNYTPYQPNGAALNNLTGTGDGCSAYGNRNFWYFFNTWFGSTTTSQYNASLATVYPYLKLKTSQSAKVTLAFKNMGTATWYDDVTAASAGHKPVHLATTNSISRYSYFAADWQLANRPGITFTKVYQPDGVTLASDQHAVNPGQIARFDFNITIPIGANPGVYREWFQPVQEGAPVWWMGGETYIDVDVQPTSFAAQVVRNTNYVSLKTSQSYRNSMYIKNVGNIEWQDGTKQILGTRPLRLATSNNVNRNSYFAEGWAANSRPTNEVAAVYESDGTTLTADQHTILPGQIARFDFNLTIPIGAESLTHREWFQPILEGAPAWWMGGETYIDVNVQPTNFDAQMFSRSSALTIAKGSSATGFIQYKNNGNIDWFDQTTVPTGARPMRLATSHNINRFSDFVGAGWLNSARPKALFSQVYNSDTSTLAANQHVVSPGQYLRYEFNITVPADKPSGTYREWFQPILEGAPAWWMGGETYIDVNVP